MDYAKELGLMWYDSKKKPKGGETIQNQEKIYEALNNLLKKIGVKTDARVESAMRDFVRIACSKQILIDGDNYERLEAYAAYKNITATEYLNAFLRSNDLTQIQIS